MSSQFIYGAYTHDLNEVALRTATQAIKDRFGRRMGEKHQWVLAGILRADTKAALNTKIQGLETAYASDNVDWTLKVDGVETAHKILNSSTFGGTRVVSPPFYPNNMPWAGRAEFALQRSYVIVLECEVRVGTGLYAHRERMLIKGTGGQKWRYSPQLVGSPHQQSLQTATSIMYVQTGMSVGRASFPSPSSPLYPSIEHEDMREIEYEGPMDIAFGGDVELFKTTWKYFMEAIAPQSFTGFVLPTI